MNKQDFLQELEISLSGIPEEEKKKTLDYYKEMIEDAADDGKSEEEIIAGFDSPAAISENLINEIPLHKFVQADVKKQRPSVSAIILIIISSPIWLSVLISLIAAVLSVYISIWSIAISFFAVFAGLAAGGLVCLGSIPFVFAENPATAVMFLGASLILMGLSVFVLFFSVWFTKLIIKLTILVLKLIKKQFIKKGRDSK